MHVSSTTHVRKPMDVNRATFQDLATHIAFVPLLTKRTKNTSRARLKLVDSVCSSPISGKHLYRVSLLGQQIRGMIAF